jgi:hypothetical protein
MLLETPGDEHGVKNVRGSGDRVTFKQFPSTTVQVWDISSGMQTHAFAGIEPSLNGNVLAFTSFSGFNGGGNLGLTVVDLNTGATQQPTMNPVGGPFVFGHELVYHSGGSLFLYDVLTQTHGVSFSPARGGTLSADYIAFVTGPNSATIGRDSPGSTIGIYNRKTNLMSFLPIAPFNVFYSRPFIYNSFLAFEAQYFDPALGFTHSDILFLDLTSGGDPINVTTNGPLTFSIHTSVFGDQIAFETKEVVITGPGFSGFTEKSDIFIYDVSDPTLINVTNNPDFVVAESASIFDGRLAYSIVTVPPVVVTPYAPG